VRLVVRAVGLAPHLPQHRATTLAGPDERQHPAQLIIGRADVVKARVGAFASTSVQPRGQAVSSYLVRCGDGLWRSTTPLPKRGLDVSLPSAGRIGP
jgi:hypothetical protein